MEEKKIDSFYVRSLVVILSATLVALFGIHYVQFLLFVFPLFFIVNIIKDGYNEGITNLLVTIVILSIVDSLNVGLFLAMGFIPFIIIMSIFIKKRESSFKIFTFSSLVFFVSLLAILVIVKLLGVDIVKIMETSFGEMLAMQLETFESMGLSNYEFFSMKELLEDLFKQVLIIIPSILLLISFFVGYINYLLSGIILKSFDIQIVEMPKFSRISLPKDIILGSLLMIGLTFLVGKLGFSYYEAVLINIGSLLTVGFFIQGFSVADYLLNKLQFKLFFKIIIYITFIFNQTFISIITIVGFVDLVFDMRKIRKRKSL